MNIIEKIDRIYTKYTLKKYLKRVTKATCINLKYQKELLNEGEKLLEDFYILSQIELLEKAKKIKKLEEKMHFLP